MSRLAFRRRWSLVVLLTAIAAVAGCTSPARPPATSSASSANAQVQPGASCPDEAKQGQVVRFGAAGVTSLAGIVVGQGPNGVVLVHPDIGNLCVWMPYALGLAQLGYHVLAFDLPGHGASGQYNGGNDAAVAAAAEWLRGQAASKIFLIGAIEGATFAAVAAARITPPVNGLVSLSGPRDYGGLDAEQAVHGLLVPAMFIAAELDDAARDDAKALFDAMPTRGVEHTLIDVPNSTDRGVRLLSAAIPQIRSGDNTVRGQIERFLRDPH
jgi:pimeloyl-ACP methyl ester carboxylesterase